MSMLVESVTAVADGLLALANVIREEFMPQVRFTADDIYNHESEPLDVDMYLVLALLVKRGELIDVRSVHEDTPPALTHNDMVYCIPGEDGYRPCHCRDCMETTIGLPGELCHDCVDADCDPRRECQARTAYGGEE